ncbi:Glycosyltransferase [Rhynchospora pubera]|uniref:Glycosyltransferase n=1 Tax=Rhynchospora pubera TaxID=906938 RepID=A0AAV8FGR0_9POAL|nr:Glycosyltransferase [Rhynchospora pubera]
MGAGHLRPMLELAKQFVRHGVSVIIPVMTGGPATDLVSKYSNSNPSISFHILPQITPTAPHPAPFVNMINTLKDYNDGLRTFLIMQSDISPISAIVLDIFCIHALDVASELGIPAYFFFTCSASTLSVFFQLLTYLPKHPMGDIGTTIMQFSGVPPLLASHLPSGLFDPTTEQYKLSLYMINRWAEGKGILVNSFESLEPRAVRALKDGFCLPNSTTPSIYCIGPVIIYEEQKEERHLCLSWLDTQPKKSVVFLCFGSKGSFPIEQLKEIANGLGNKGPYSLFPCCLGCTRIRISTQTEIPYSYSLFPSYPNTPLENSGQRFLWVLRSPPTVNPAKVFQQTAEPDLDILLPEGFLDRTKDRGMIVQVWVPQVEVLKHEAVGGFVSHCGWNSTLEALNFGVPMICWPLYAEQKMNKVFLVEEMKVGVELKGYEDGFVRADEIEAKVRWIIESDGAMDLKNRMMEVKESAIKAMEMEEGGSSFGAFIEFLECLN